MAKNTKPGSEDQARNKGGRPPGSVSRQKREAEMLRELVDTKCKAAELALDNLRLRLQRSKSREEQLRISKMLTDIVEQIERVDPEEA